MFNTFRRIFPNKLKSLAQTAAEGIALKNINDQ